MSNEILDQFLTAQQYLDENLEQMIVTYLCGLWDPLIEYVILKEMNNIIDNELEQMFPDLPEHLMPRYSYRIFKDEETEENESNVEVEISVQRYINHQKGLTFLGNYAENSGVSYDLYCSNYYDGLSNFLFYARYGHSDENCFTGAAEARSEYHLGMMTPLSIAYGMAIHDGYVNE